MRPSFSRKKARRGYLLTEAVVVVGVSSTLAAVAIAVLASLLGVERTGRRRLETTNTLMRLSMQFRHDVAAADNALLGETPQVATSELRLRLADGCTVTYRAESGQVVRSEDDGQTSPVHEAFLLPSAFQAQFAIEADSAFSFAVMTLGEPIADQQREGARSDQFAKRRRTAVRDGVARHGWTVEALLGRDLRHGSRSSDASTGHPQVQP
jgi:hypothetical protein